MYVSEYSWCVSTLIDDTALYVLGCARSQSMGTWGMPPPISALFLTGVPLEGVVLTAGRVCCDQKDHDHKVSFPLTVGVCTHISRKPRYCPLNRANTPLHASIPDLYSALSPRSTEASRDYGGLLEPPRRRNRTSL